MDRFITLTVTGLSQGAIIALIALGFLVIYKATGVINFAQGDLVTLLELLEILSFHGMELDVLVATADSHETKAPVTD